MIDIKYFLNGFKYIIIIFYISLTIFPRHLLGLNALMGAIEIFFELRLSIGPYTDRLYAVLPAGVDNKTPSETNFLII